MKSLKFFLIIISLFIVTPALPIHIKAGNITAANLSGFTWRIRIAIYTHKESIDTHSELEKEMEALDVAVFKDENLRISYLNIPKTKVARTSKTQLNEDTYENLYEFTYRFSGSGPFKIGVLIPFRNDNILNIKGGASHDVPFFLETYVLISSLSAAGNSTPDLLVPPIDKAKVGEVYLHNPGASDVNGDSLAFRLIVPKSATENSDPENPEGEVPMYNYPEGISIDPNTGTVKWDRPQIAGQFNVAFIIDEYRNGIRIGSVLRDMQIEVKESDNKPPVLKIPEDTCLVAGMVYEKEISATDPDNDSINLFAFNGLIQTGSGKITFKLPFSKAQYPPAIGTLTVKASCDLISNKPYQIIFKAEDLPQRKPPPLSDFKILKIKIAGPPVRGLKAKANEKSVDLSWEKYIDCRNSETIHIYRSSCDVSNPTVSICEKMEAPAGFNKIGEVSADAVSFTDDNNGKGLKQGGFYCYSLQVKFKGNGEGIFSDRVCAEPGSNLPVPVIADVLTTDGENGKILVRWRKPELTTEKIAVYVVSRKIKDSLNGVNIIPISGNVTDTTFIDSLLNTTVPYIYQVNAVSETGKVFASNSFSTVDLKLTPGSGKVSLKWMYSVPWRNNEISHRIFRKSEKETVFQLLSSLIPTDTEGFYTDAGLSNDDSVCYYVETAGIYCLEKDTILNKSQIVCTIPSDSTLPCAPVLNELPIVCAPVNISANDLSWHPVKDIGCNPIIVAYNIYRSERENQAGEILAKTSETFYSHIDSNSLAGCYEVTAVNLYGAESPKSNRVCTDICVQYSLPDLITPDGDGKNDIFKPFQDHLNAESIKVEIYNRWGGTVFQHEGNADILWDGGNESGGQVSDGVYFYSATVKFRRRLNPADEYKVLKGWIQVVSSKATIDK